MCKTPTHLSIPIPTPTTCSITVTLFIFLTVFTATTHAQFRLSPISKPINIPLPNNASADNIELYENLDPHASVTQSQQYITGTATIAMNAFTLHNPLHHFSVYEALNGGCQSHSRTTAQENAEHRHCIVATNAGYFDPISAPPTMAAYFNGACLGNVVTDGVLSRTQEDVFNISSIPSDFDRNYVQMWCDAHSSQCPSIVGHRNVNFGVTSDGQFFVGYMDDEFMSIHMPPRKDANLSIDNATQAQPSPLPMYNDQGDWYFTQLVSGVGWILRDGVNVVAENWANEEDQSTQQTGSSFPTIVSGRTALGHTLDGELVLVIVSGIRISSGLTDRNTMCEYDIYTFTTTLTPKPKLIWTGGHLFIAQPSNQGILVWNFDHATGLTFRQGEFLGIVAHRCPLEMDMTRNTLLIQQDAYAAAELGHSGTYMLVYDHPVPDAEQPAGEPLDFYSEDSGHMLYSYDMVCTSEAHSMHQPQLSGFQGQQFHAAGLPGEIYNLVSAPDMQLNARFDYISSGLCFYHNTECWTHPGLYIGELGFSFANRHSIRVVGGPHDLGLQVYVDGTLLTPDPTLGFYEYGSEYSAQYMDPNTIIIRSPHFMFLVLNSHMFLNLNVKLLDAAVLKAGSVYSSPNKPYQYPHVPIHGILGCTWKNAKYSGNEYIEGVTSDYRVAGGIFSQKYKYKYFSV